MASDLAQKGYDQLSAVGGAAVILEIRLKFLANKTKAIEQSSFSYKAYKTEAAVVDHFCDIGLMTPEEGKFLSDAREIRNRFLHGKFDEGVALIEKDFGKLPGSSVVRFQPSEGQSLFDHLTEVMAGKVDPVPVGSLSLEEAGHFPWFLEAYHRGAFVAAHAIFTEAIAIVDRVSNAHARLNLKPQ